MRSGSWSRAELKLKCLRRVWESAVIGFRKEVLVNWIYTYVQLTGEDAAEFQWLLEQDENKEIQEMELTWAEQIEAKGRAQAIKQMQGAVLRQIEQRFGGVPERVQAKVRGINSIDRLAELLTKLPLLESAEDLVARRRKQKSSN